MCHRSLLEADSENRFWSLQNKNANNKLIPLCCSSAELYQLINVQQWIDTSTVTLEKAKKYCFYLLFWFICRWRQILSLPVFHGNNTAILFLLYCVNLKTCVFCISVHDLWSCTDIQPHSALLTLSGQLTSLTDKMYFLHLNQPPIILMVWVPQHWMSPILRKWSDVMS